MLTYPYPSRPTAPNTQVNFAPPAPTYPSMPENRIGIMGTLAGLGLLRGLQRCGTHGLGCGCAATPGTAGLGVLEDVPTSTLLAVASLQLLGAAVAGYHGYRRDGDSVGSLFVWAIAGLVAPVITVPIAFVQGYAQR